MEANVVVSIRHRNLIEIRLCLIEPSIGAIKIIIVCVCYSFGAVPYCVSGVEVCVVLPHIAGWVRKLWASGVDTKWRRGRSSRLDDFDTVQNGVLNTFYKLNNYHSVGDGKYQFEDCGSVGACYFHYVKTSSEKGIFHIDIEHSLASGCEITEEE